MEVTFTHDIHYSNKKHLPLKDVANALLALENTSKPVSKVLESLYEDVVVKNIRLEVEELHSGSLYERIQYYLTLVIQKHIEKESGVELKRLEGIDKNQTNNTVAWIAIAVIIIAAKLAADKYWPSKPKQHIENQIQITLEAGHDITGIEIETLRSTIEEAISSEPESMKGAVEFSKPAKKRSFSSDKF